MVFATSGSQLIAGMSGHQESAKRSKSVKKGVRRRAERGQQSDILAGPRTQEEAFGLEHV